MIKYKIGDFVRFVDEAIEGYITSFRGDGMVGVTDDTGFELPVQIDKITKVHGNMNRKDDLEIDPQAQIIKQPQTFVDEGIYIAVEPIKENNLAILYVINETSYELLVSISKSTKDKYEGIKREIIAPQKVMEFYKDTLSHLGRWPSFNLQILKHTSGQKELQIPIDKTVKINAIELSQKPKSIDLLNSKGWIFQIDSHEKLDLKALEQNFMSHRPTKKNI